MTIYLKQSTASQEVALGFFVDSTDGNTEETGLTIAAADIRLHKAGGTTLTTPAAGATHISNGIYYWVADATDTGTLGPLVIYCHPSGALAVRVECCVLAANVYDSLIGGGDLLQVDSTQLLGQSLTVAAPVTILASVGTAATSTAQTGDSFALANGANGFVALKSDTAAILVDTGTTLDALIQDIPTVAEFNARTLPAASYATPTNITAATGIAVSAIGANAINAASIATGAFTAAKFDAGAIDAAALATTAVDEIRDGVWAKVQTELTGDPGATPTVLQSLALPYMAIRNKRDTDSGLGTDEIHNSAGTVILTATISDAAGLFSKAKYA